MYSGEFFFEFGNEVCAFPWEAAVFLRFASEVSEGGGGLVDGFFESESIADVGWSEAEDFLYFFFKGLRIALCVLGEAEIEAGWFGFTDGIGDLDETIFGKPCGDDIFGEVSGGVSGGAIDLAWVFS